LPDVTLHNIPKWKKYTKLAPFIPIGYKLRRKALKYQEAIKHTKKLCQGLQKSTQI
jgi:hypothetical protein